MRTRIRSKLSFGESHSNLVPEWDELLNGELSIFDVTAGSNLKVAWRCPDGHGWSTLIQHRVNGSQCPYCSGRLAISGVNDLVTLHPDVVKLWDWSRNEVDPRELLPRSAHRAWWRCSCGHRWQAQVAARVRGSGCKKCVMSSRVFAPPATLASSEPEVAAQWHPTRNGVLTPHDVTRGSNRRVWWKCPEGDEHEWATQVAARTRKNPSSCPFCMGSKVVRADSVGAKHPRLVAELHPVLSAGVDLFSIAERSSRRIWWKCSRGHEWRSLVFSRVMYGRDCQRCYGLSDGNSLAECAPFIASQWHPTKNGSLTPDDISRANEYRAWWLCEEGHEWQTKVASRVSGQTGCPECSQSGVSLVELRLRDAFADHGLDVRHDVKLSAPGVRGGTARCDFVVERLRSVVEYDGSYWHRNKLGTDVRKTKALLAQGWTVLRIREQPLPSLGVTDDGYIEVETAADYSVDAVERLALIVKQLLPAVEPKPTPTPGAATAPAATSSAKPSATASARG